VAAGYLRVEKADRNKFPAVRLGHNGVVYVLAQTVAETAHGTVIERGHSTVGEKGKQPCPKRATGAVSSSSNEIKKKELSKGMNGNPPPDRKEPWQIRKENNAEVAEREAQIKRLRDDRSNWEIALAKDIKENIAWLKKNKTEGWQGKIKAMEANRKNYVRIGLIPEVQEQVSVSLKRIAELRTTVGNGGR